MGERWAGPAWATTPVPATDGTVLFLDCSKDGTIVESAQLDTQPFYVLGRNQLVVDLPTEHPSCSRQVRAHSHCSACSPTRYMLSFTPPRHCAARRFNSACHGRSSSAHKALGFPRTRNAMSPITTFIYRQPSCGVR
jgi:hypothetical protein